MSQPSIPKPVKLIVSLIAGKEKRITEASTELSQSYGKIDYMSAFIPFTMTEYYQAEMGEGLMRRLISFADLLDPERFPEVKQYTDKLEAHYITSEGNRTINLDPGYMTLYQFILATNKRFAHRIYLRDGVYADLTLIYKKKSFQPLAWTYPDYGSTQIIELLNRLRERYQKQLQEPDPEDH
jgi:hypothetical protein